MNKSILFRSKLLVLVLLLFCIFFQFSSSQIFAQTNDTQVDQLESGAEPSPNDLKELLRLLSDNSIRNWLLEKSQDLELNDGSQTIKNEDFTHHLNRVLDKGQARLSVLGDMWNEIVLVPEMIKFAWDAQVNNTQSLRLLIYIVTFLFIGIGFEWLYREYIKYPKMQIELSNAPYLKDRVTATVKFLLIQMGAIATFSLGSIGAFLTFEWPDLVKQLVLEILLAILVVRILASLSNLLFSPRQMKFRLVPFSNHQALLCHRWTVALIVSSVLGFVISGSFQSAFEQIGIEKSATVNLSISIVINAILAALAISAIWHLKTHFVEHETNSEVSRGSLSNPWPAFLTLATVLIFSLWLLDIQNLMISVVILLILFAFLKLSRDWITNLFAQASQSDKLHGGQQQLKLSSAAESEIDSVAKGATEIVEDTEIDRDVELDEKIEEQRSHQIYRPILIRIVRFLLIIFAVLALVKAWGIDLFSLSASQTFSGKVFDIILDTLFAVLLADLVWHWAKSVIDRRLADYVPPVDGQAPGPEARMATLLPLLRMMLFITLLTMVILSVLTSLGINIGPLLAGAGVLGVAIGFGAQALVRDVVSGIFFLIDDAFRIGEYIEIENLRGTVESMSLRSLRVRHHRGAVHTIPFGELKSLTNYSRDWVIMKLEFRVPFDTDLKLVKKLVKKIGAELAESEVYGDSILQTLKSQGVRRMEEFNMVVGVKFMAKPGEQWVIRRDAYQKVRDAFDANGIGFAERNVKVEVIGDKPLDEKTKKAALGAAQNIVDQQLPPVPLKDEP